MTTRNFENDPADATGPSGLIEPVRSRFAHRVNGLPEMVPAEPGWRAGDRVTVRLWGRDLKATVITTNAWGIAWVKVRRPAAPPAR